MSVERFAQLCKFAGLSPKPSSALIVKLDAQEAAAKADADARALSIVEGVDPIQADALEYMIKSALMQWYHRGAIDALERARDAAR